MTDSNNPTLILIDCQEGFHDWDYWGGNRNNPDVEQNLKSLLEFWRDNNRPIAHVIHHSLNPESPLRTEKTTGKIMASLTPKKGEPVIFKRANSAFAGTDLDGYLRRLNTNRLIIAGLTTNHCVGTSVRMAENMGYTVKMVADACATFDRLGPTGKTYKAQQIHEMALADLHGEFCQVVDVAEVVG